MRISRRILAGSPAKRRNKSYVFGFCVEKNRENVDNSGRIVDNSTVVHKFKLPFPT
jgi:hypothetical protein